MPKEVAEGTEKTLKLARVTVVECKLLRALTVSVNDIDEARELVQDQSKTFNVGRINPMVDLHKTIWKCSQQVARGVRMEAAKKAALPDAAAGAAGQ